MRLAIIDMGTNTFNLLIAEVREGEPYSIICTGKEPVKLGEGGINNRVIAPAAYKRGISAMKNLDELLKEYQVKKVFAFATSAIRSAENGLQFIEEVNEKFNISVELISGDREAELIYYGVRQAGDLGMDKSLILDIGGGSNELIIANRETIFWKESFPLGMARLLEKFKPSDPITLKEIQDIENYVEEHLTSFFKAMLQYKPIKLIGASGSFDTFRALVNEENIHIKSQKPCFGINPEKFSQLHNKLIQATREERINMKGMEPVRVEMIVIASIFVNFILQKTNLSQLIQCSYSLKEGALDQIIKKQLSFA
jgi:exopolyphosphatase / guanosine-5'-triphosphate,3'-diphosphate pyrophosphatase